MRDGIVESGSVGVFGCDDDIAPTMGVVAVDATGDCDAAVCCCCCCCCCDEPPDCCCGDGRAAPLLDAFFAARFADGDGAGVCAFCCGVDCCAAGVDGADVGVPGVLGAGDDVAVVFFAIAA